MTCDCHMPFVHEPPKIICTGCGVETEVLENNDRHESYEDVFVCVYSRRKRFEALLDSVLFPSFEKKDTPIFEAIGTQKFDTTADIIEHLKTLELPDKRFCSVHLFAKHMLKEYTPPEVPTLDFKAQIMYHFDQILSRHQAMFHGKTFFSYPWLLKHILHYMGVDHYEQYIKPIRCARRRKKYSKLLKALFSGDLYGYTFQNHLT